MNSVTDMVLQNSIHPHPGIGVRLNHAFTGNQNQTAQGFKGLKTYSGYWHYSWHSHQPQFTSQHLSFIIKLEIVSAQPWAAQSPTLIIFFLLFF